MKNLLRYTVILLFAQQLDCAMILENKKRKQRQETEVEILELEESASKKAKVANLDAGMGLEPMVDDNADLVDALLNGDINNDPAIEPAKESINKKNDAIILPLITAVQEDNVTDLCKLILEDININLVDSTGKSALTWAILEKNKEFANVLLEHGADIDLQDNTGNTPLHWAIENEQYGLVCFLIDNKANIELADINGITPLNLACSKADPLIVKKLLQVKANANTWDKAGATPLMRAIKDKNEEILDLLLPHSNLNIISIDQRCALTVAMANNLDPEIIQKLLQAGASPLLNRVNNKTKQYETPLEFALKLKNQEYIKLLQDEVDVYNHNTPLFVGLLTLVLSHQQNPYNYIYMQEKNRIEAEVKMSLEAYFTRLITRINPNHLIPDRRYHQKNEPAILRIIRQGDLNVIKEVFTNGVLTKNKEKALAQAFRDQNFDVINFLLNQNTDINKGLILADSNFFILPKEHLLQILTNCKHFNKAKAGHVILNAAFNLNDKELIRKMRDEGFTLDDRHGNILTRAAHYGDLELMKLAKEADVEILQDQNCRFQYFVGNDNLEAVNKLIDCGFDVNFKTTVNNTPLIEAVRSEKIDLVKLLLEKGANVNAVSTYCISPLKLAVMHDNYELASILLKANANPNLQNKQGDTILTQLLAKKSAKRRYYFTKLLLDYKADPKIKNNKGQSAFDLANRQIKKLLKEYPKEDESDNDGDSDSE